MRLLKRPKEQPKPLIEGKAVVVATYTRGDTNNKAKVKQYQIQTIDGFVEKIKLCIGKPNYFQKSNSIFNSKVRGVLYQVYPIVCNTPEAEMVVGVKIVDPIQNNTLEITGSTFAKEDVLKFVDRCYMMQVSAGILTEVK